jgi:hypothetical protein
VDEQKDKSVSDIVQFTFHILLLQREKAGVRGTKNANTCATINIQFEFFTKTLIKPDFGNCHENKSIILQELAFECMLNLKFLLESTMLTLY